MPFHCAALIPLPLSYCFFLPNYDNIFAVALGLQIQGTSKSSNDWKCIASARKELLFHTQANARLFDISKSGCFSLFFGGWGEINLGGVEEVEVERGNDHHGCCRAVGLLLVCVVAEEFEFVS